jgi:hypothetical protein
MAKALIANDINENKFFFDVNSMTPFIRLCSNLPARAIMNGA